MKPSEREFANPMPDRYLLTVSLAQQAYRLSAFCKGLMRPENREAFRADTEKAMRDAGLAESEKQLVRDRDWMGMVRYGVTHFLVFRIAGMFGEGLVGVAARMRGETLEEFRKSRRVWEER